MTLYSGISRYFTKKRNYLLVYAILILFIIFIFEIFDIREINDQLINSSADSIVGIDRQESFLTLNNNSSNNSKSTHIVNSTDKSDLLMKLFIEVPPDNGRGNNPVRNIQLDNNTLNVISKTIYQNITQDIYFIERAMNRSPNQEEYVKIKEKYYSLENYRKIYCLSDLEDLLLEPDIQPVVDEGCNAPLLTINYFGRMGNQISQYLSLFVLNTIYNASIAMFPEMDAYLMLMFENRTIPIIPVFCEKHFNRTKSSYNFVYTYLAVERLSSKKFNETYEYGTTFEESHIFMFSYPCPVHIFMKRRAMLKKELRLLPSLLSNANSKLNELTPPAFRQNSTLVSIHVRRTDYKVYAERFSHLLLSINYYRRAINFFRNSSRFGTTIFMVFSDDMQWVRTRFIDNDIFIAGDGDEVNPFLDFAMMSQCDHHILGFGTFSFTAALLGNGLIIYPLPTVAHERVFGTQRGYLCSESIDIIPIPDIP